MKHFASLALAIAFSVPTVASAQDDNRPKREPGTLRRPNGGAPAPREGAPGLRDMPRPEAVERGLGMMLRNLPLMKALDVDEDGQLSQSEIENASKSLMKLDKNGDGVLSTEELRPEPGPAFNAMANAMGPNGRLAPVAMSRMFEMRDANGDGKLTGDEIPPPMRERLSVIDQNGDEAIDKAEAEAAMQRMQGRAMPNRPEREGSGGQGVPPRRPQGDGN